MLCDVNHLCLSELYSSEIRVLSSNSRGAGREVMLYDGDDFTGIKTIPPPPPHHALVLVDPSLEDGQGYTCTIQSS